jgi:twitching motility protein PilU
VTTRFDAQPVELEVAFTPGRHGESATVQLWRDGLADPDRILGAAVTAGASDIVLLEGAPPTLRVDRVALPLPDSRPLGSADLRKLMRRLLLPSHRAQFEATGETNASHRHPELGRFRVTCYRAMGAAGMVLRRVRTDVPHLETLELPPVLGTLAMERRGLVLVSGATGSGTSTTVAAMLDYRNTRAPGHIVTIEDPIEFVHARKQSVVSQREVGVDTGSPEVALRTALRQSPDVIFVGALHERDTVATALRAAEAGHLVLSTMHASSAAGAVEQLLGLFPVDARDGLLMQLSLVLRAVIAQRLVPRSDGKGHVAAVEVVLNAPRVQALLRRGELELWGQAAEDGGVDGSRSLDQALLTLYQQRKISQDDALRFADGPDALRLWIKGTQ